MKCVYFDWILLFIGNFLAVSADYQYNISTFDVPLDHFSFVNNKTFPIR